MPNEKSVKKKKPKFVLFGFKFGEKNKTGIENGRNFKQFEMEYRFSIKSGISIILLTYDYICIPIHIIYSQW